MWPLSVFSATPVAVSYSLTLSSREADASSVLSGEKATELTQCVWPSRVCSDALRSSSTLGNLCIHLGILSSNCLLTMLFAGAKISALQYVGRGSCSTDDRQLRENRFIS